MYVKTSNGVIAKFPYTVGELRKENPNTSFPKNPSDETLMSWGVFKVVTPPQPTFDTRTEKLCVEDIPVFSGAEWSLPFSVQSKTHEEVLAYDASVAEVARLRRNQYLSDTDWWASSDLTMTAEQTAYRQALRDITSHANWPHLDEADWPTKP